MKIRRIASKVDPGWEPLDHRKKTIDDGMGAGPWVKLGVNFEDVVDLLKTLFADFVNFICGGVNRAIFNLMRILSS